MFWSAPALVRATELRPLVVTGIALDKVATFHPAPVYPRTALALGIDGNVKMQLKVQNGRITEANVFGRAHAGVFRETMDRPELEV